jgi:pimeloyl-ACP methyl ester carboxylesterase
VKTRALLALLTVGLLGFSLSEAGVRSMARQLERGGLDETTFTDTGAGSIMRYFVGGDGPPLLMIHGFGGDGVVTWRGQVPALRAHRRLIIPDLLWFGGSSSTAPPTLTAQARAQLALLDHLGVERADVMGISYGGFVLLRMAQLAPDRLGKIIIVDSPGPQFTDDEVQSMLDRLGAEQPADIFLPNSPDDVRRIMDLTFHKPPPLPRLILRDIQRNLFDEHRTEQTALLEDLPTNRVEITDEMLASFDDIFVVWGRHDPIFPLATGQRLAESLRAELYIVEDADHGPNVEHPDDFNRAVLGFLLP